MLAGQAVATVLLGGGIIGVSLWVGPSVLNGMLAQDVFFGVASYSLSIIPMYLFMAQLLVRGGVIKDLFSVGHKLSGYRRYPLGAATIIIGALLGAVSGSGSASAASLAALASPELEKVGYTKRFSVALAAVAGSLSAMIPPSLVIIIYGSLTMTPIGHLFIGSVIPALLCILVYLLCLHVFGKNNISEDINLDTSAKKEGAASATSSSPVKSFIFVLLLMFFVFGGIYGGVVTVGEAGAMGAFFSFLGMLLMGRVNKDSFRLAVLDSVKITSMLMMLVIGAQVLARFFSISRIPREIMTLAEPLIAHPSLLVMVLLLAIFVAGMILESVAVIVLVVPIIMPMLDASQIDLVWFGVMASFMISLGLITPPVGLSAYAASAAANVNVANTFRSCMPFSIVAAVVVSALMILFPEIVTWLPNKMNN